MEKLQRPRAGQARARLCARLLTTGLFPCPAALPCWGCPRTAATNEVSREQQGLGEQRGFVLPVGTFLPSSLLPKGRACAVVTGVGPCCGAAGAWLTRPLTAGTCTWQSHRPCVCKVPALFICHPEEYLAYEQLVPPTKALHSFHCYSHQKTFPTSAQAP